LPGDGRVAPLDHTRAPSRDPDAGGTGTTTSAASVSPSSFTTFASRSANQAPNGSICSNFSSRMASSFVLASRAEQGWTGSGVNAGRGRPQISHAIFDASTKEERHSPQSGTRLAPVSSRSQMRHLAGKNTLTSASLTPANQRRPVGGQLCKPRRRAEAFSMDELPSATQAEIYTFY
jgi:hypothetical protein